MLEEKEKSYENALQIEKNNFSQLKKSYNQLVNDNIIAKEVIKNLTKKNSELSDELNKEKEKNNQLNNQIISLNR